MKNGHNKLPAGFKPAMLKEEWEQFVEEHGHTPTWPPHDGYTRMKNNKKEE